MEEDKKNKWKIVKDDIDNIKSYIENADGDKIYNNSVIEYDYNNSKRAKGLLLLFNSSIYILNNNNQGNSIRDCDIFFIISDHNYNNSLRFRLRNSTMFRKTTFSNIKFVSNGTVNLKNCKNNSYFINITTVTSGEHEIVKFFHVKDNDFESVLSFHYRGYPSCCGTSILNAFIINHEHKFNYGEIRELLFSEFHQVQMTAIAIEYSLLNELLLSIGFNVLETFENKRDDSKHTLNFMSLVNEDYYQYHAEYDNEDEYEYDEEIEDY